MGLHTNEAEELARKEGRVTRESGRCDGFYQCLGEEGGRKGEGSSGLGGGVVKGFVPIHSPPFPSFVEHLETGGGRGRVQWAVESVRLRLPLREGSGKRENQRPRSDVGP